MMKSFVTAGLTLCMIGGSAVVAYSQDQAAAKSNGGTPAAVVPAKATIAITAAASN